MKHFKLIQSDGYTAFNSMEDLMETEEREDGEDDQADKQIEVTEGLTDEKGGVLKEHEPTVEVLNKKDNTENI